MQLFAQILLADPPFARGQPPFLDGATLGVGLPLVAHARLLARLQLGILGFEALAGRLQFCFDAQPSFQRLRQFRLGGGQRFVSVGGAFGG